MPPRLGYGTGMGNSDMLRGGNGIGVPRPKPAPLLTLVLSPIGERERRHKGENRLGKREEREYMRE